MNIQTKQLEYVEAKPASGGAAKNMVVMLHGLGSDANDLISIAPEWAGELPDTLFVSPNAPFPCDMAPYGFQWFSLQERTPEKILAGVETAMPILNAFIDQQLEKNGMTDGQLAVVGFSQGTMMALHTMPRRAKPCACVVGYSGALVDPEGLKDVESLVKMPILAVHGDADDVVHPGNLERISDGFEAAGFEIEAIMRPNLAHGIDMVGLKRGGSFIAEAFDKS